MIIGTHIKLSHKAKTRYEDLCLLNFALVSMTSEYDKSLNYVCTVNMMPTSHEQGKIDFCMQIKINRKIEEQFNILFDRISKMMASTLNKYKPEFVEIRDCINQNKTEHLFTQYRSITIKWEVRY